MDKRKKGKNKTTSIAVIVIIILISLITDILESRDMNSLLPSIIIIIVSVFTAGVLIAASKARKSVSQKKPESTPVKPAVRKYTGTEEAIGCSHKRGRDKYIEQINTFLANGIIDKAEYRLLKERYENLDLPDDFH